MDIQSLLLAAALAQGSHTGGHFQSGAENGIPMHLSGLAEVWEKRPKDNTDAARIHGAGFRAQEELNRMAEGTDIERQIRLANALIKLGYTAGVPQMLSPGLAGDFQWMDRTSGSRNAKPFVALSGLSDLYHAYNPQTKYDVGFDQSPNGTPLLTLSGKF